jgi:hypothetical protein
MTRSLGPCPTDEELAAYIDGGLGPAESRHVTEHLASCGDCYDLYVETARFLVKSSAATSDDGADEGRLVRFPSPAERRQQVAQWLSIAALLLVGAGGGIYFQFLQAPPALMPLALNGPSTRYAPPVRATKSYPTVTTHTWGEKTTIPNPSAQIPNFWKGPTFRGEGGGDEAKLNDASFRMGVQSVNLQVSLKAGNGTEAEDGVARILGILKGQPFTDDLKKGYTGITLAVENRKAPADLLPEASRLAGLSRDAFESTYLDLGQWVEAGRLAALSHNPFFFQQSDTRSFLRRSIWRSKLGIGETKLDPPTLQNLERISDIVSKGNLQASDYARLQQPFDEILKIHYPDT